MLLKFFELLSIFDWVTPAIAVVEDVVEGGPLNLDAWTFHIPYEEAAKSGWSSGDIENLLSQYGIRTWGGLFNFGQFRFRVKLEQAAWAEYILARHGIPMHERSLGAPRVAAKEKPDRQESRPARTRDALSFLDDLYDKIFPPFLP
jgi:hypothetical protein